VLLLSWQSVMVQLPELFCSSMSNTHSQPRQHSMRQLLVTAWKEVVFGFWYDQFVIFVGSVAFGMGWRCSNELLLQV
jgi:hypothetical protein